MAYVDSCAGKGRMLQQVVPSLSRKSHDSQGRQIVFRIHEGIPLVILEGLLLVAFLRNDEYAQSCVEPL